jgi:hypothetical protein
MIKLILMLLLLPILAFGNDNPGDCNHPRFLEHGCPEQGTPGPQGEQGEQGESIVGPQGEQGIPGIQGTAGIASQTWINETRNWQSKWYNYSAASDAIQVHLPQDQPSRVTFGIARTHGTSGYAVGYAFKNEKGLAFTLALGKSGSEEVGKASVGFEFGGSSREPHRHNVTCNYVRGELSMGVDEEQSCKED